jgi:sterol desaturase/sphingolipid hydroxylase (fatty acid hydroxylase superfamily)
MTVWIQSLMDAFAAAQQWLFEAVVQPVIFAIGLGGLVEDGFTATGWFLVGLLQLVILVGIIGPLQRWRPVEPVTDSTTIRTDILYTLIHRLGFFRLALFFTLDPLLESAFGALRVQGVGTFHLDQWAFGWLGFENALLGFLLYLVVFDFADYWIHRAQHQLHWWWQLHSLHHAQRQMTMWSDNRNHLLDDALRDTILVMVGFAVGIAPGQFVALVALTQLSESFQHANLKIWFGKVGERLWVSPRFHRLHHAVGLGHEFPAKAQRVARPPQDARAPSGGSGDVLAQSVGARLGGANFGVLLPWWDMIFGTANFERRFEPTGVRDQVELGRHYGRGFVQQQWLGLKRLAGKA